MNRKTENILVFLLFIICLAIRIAFITQKNLWFDEVFSWHLSLDNFYTIIVRTANDIHPPLFYFILKIWTSVFGDSVAAMRLISAIFTASAVFFLYPLSKRYLDIPGAVLVVLLYIVSPLNLYYSQEVRMAGINLFWNLGSVYFLLKLTDKPHNYHRIFKDKFTLTYVLFSAAAIYTHYFSFFILAAELLYILYTYRKSPKQYISYIFLLVSVIIIYLPWIPELINHFTRGQSWRSPQTLYDVLHEYVNYSRDLNLGLYYYYTNLEIVKYITYFAGIIVLLSVTGYFLRSGKEKNRPLLVLMVLFIPLILAGIISFKQRIEFYRYLSILVPYISLFIVYGLSKWNRNFIIYPLVAALIMINIYGVYIHNSFNFKNDDYRELINKINREYLPGERIYVEPHYNGWTINYYKKQNKLRIPDPVYIRYGWNELIDSLKAQDPPGFFLVMDYSAVDTSKYHENITSLKKNFDIEEKTTYFLAPTKVELYRFSRKILQ